ncbi:MAG TPA: sigma-70 family RNA polymerase sigma factor, partial [Gaiellaceae bacterium]|nr:sigma-70 family RNA polymerase sigma factor [Gaiellaceae bacterium]
MAVTESGHLASSAIDDLYRRHGGEIYRYALAVLGNHADAEDVTQTTFLNAYRSLEQGVRPRKPLNWLLTIASNPIKQRFRQEQTRPRQVEFIEETAECGAEEDGGPSVGELLVALSKIPPQQRQAIVLREFEGRSYAEIAQILDVTTTALETLLFRARRSLAEELEHQLTCTEAQLAISRAADGRLGRKERRRLRDHLAECPDCARFAGLQHRNRRALKGLMFVPIPLSLTFFKGFEGTATAATMPAAASGVAAAGATTMAAGGATGGGIFAGGLAVKAAAVVTAASLTGGVAVVGSSTVGSKPAGTPPAQSGKPGERLGQVAPRGVLVPGNGIARGKTNAPGQAKRLEAKERARTAKARAAKARKLARTRSVEARANARG